MFWCIQYFSDIVPFVFEHWTCEKMHSQFIVPVPNGIWNASNANVLFLFRKLCRCIVISAIQFVSLLLWFILEWNEIRCLDAFRIVWYVLFPPVQCVPSYIKVVHCSLPSRFIFHYSCVNRVFYHIQHIAVSSMPIIVLYYLNACISIHSTSDLLHIFIKWSNLYLDIFCWNMAVVDTQKA